MAKSRVPSIIVFVLLYITVEENKGEAWYKFMQGGREQAVVNGRNARQLACDGMLIVLGQRHSYASPSKRGADRHGHSS